MKQATKFSWLSAMLSITLQAALMVTIPAQADPSSDCADLTSMFVEDTTITSASITPPAGALPEHCRVVGYVDTEINFELRMPTDWNRKFYHRGQGGLVGTIGEFGPGLSRGYAEVATDTGHVGRPPFPELDGFWALDRPDREINYGFRAIHVVTVAAKAITEEYYEDEIAYSYFEGCSNGGRQGLMEAQRFPEDFDGIVAGAPVVDYTGLALGWTWNLQALASAPNLWTKLPALDATSMAACDSEDGLEDGLIRDQGRCAFDPSVLTCPYGEDTPACLTEAEVEAVQKVLAGPSNSWGEQLYRGVHQGAENGWFGWITGPVGLPTFQALLVTEFHRYLLFDDPLYNPLNFDFDSDVAALEATGDFLNATDPDLSAFKANNGKLIMWHGWSDPAVVAGRTIQYYHDVIRETGGNKHRVREFSRLFLVPGMLHCLGGSGPNQFDALGALEDWVENGNAPDQIIASGVSGQTQPLCAYPEVAVYKRGDPSDATSFTCKNRGLGYSLKGF